MNFFKFTRFRKSTGKRTSSVVESVTPISPISDVVDDVDEDEIDYTPCIQQEAAGIRLEKIKRAMIEEKIGDFNRWSEEHRKWAEKYKRSLQTKDSSFQSYTITLNLFLEAISLCDQIAVQFDESRKELEKILQKIPKHEKPAVKLKLAEESSMMNEAKHNLDALEKKRRQVQNNLDRIRTNLRSSDPNERKHKKLQKDQKSLIQQRKELKQQIKMQQENCRQAQEQYRTNTEKIYQESQKKELNRLKSIPDSLKSFVTALQIDSPLMKDAIENHNAEIDLNSWKEKHFSPSFKQTTV